MIDGDTTDFTQFEQANAVPAETAPVDPPAEPEPVEPDPADPPADPEAAKPKKDFQSRIDEVTRARREAEREAKYWRDVAMGKVQPEPKQPEGPKAPNPDDFELGDLDPRYVQAVIAHEVKQGITKGLDEIRGTVAQDTARQAQARVWEARQAEARAEFADYDDKVISGAHNWPCTEEMAEAIRTSDVGGKVAYHLASNPAEAHRIAELSPIAQVREIGRLEARYEGAKSQPKPTTSAPTPPKGQARGAGGQFESNASTTDFAAFEAMANRKS